MPTELLYYQLRENPAARLLGPDDFKNPTGEKLAELMADTARSTVPAPGHGHLQPVKVTSAVRERPITVQDEDVLSASHWTLWPNCEAVLMKKLEGVSVGSLTARGR